jgi:hypothetical protein
MKSAKELLKLATVFYKEAAKLSLDPTGVNWEPGLADEEAFGYEPERQDFLKKREPHWLDGFKGEENVNVNHEANHNYKDAIVFNAKDAVKVAERFNKELLSYKGADKVLCMMARREVKNLIENVCSAEEALNIPTNRGVVFENFSDMIEDGLHRLQGVRLVPICSTMESFTKFTQVIQNLCFMLNAYGEARKIPSNNNSGTFA